MDLFEFAMQMEKDGEEYYRQLADKTDVEGFTAIFTRLAEAEVRHYNVLRQLKEQQATDLEEVPLDEEAKNIFTELKAAGQLPTVDPNAVSPQVEMYRHAQELEKKSMEFYREKTKGMDDSAARTALIRLGDEEEKHYWLLDNIIESVSRPDFGWIEFAEWRHADEY